MRNRRLMAAVLVAGLAASLLTVSAPSAQAAVLAQDIGIASPTIVYPPYKQSSTIYVNTQYHLTHSYTLRIQRHRWYGWETMASRYGNTVNPSISYYCYGTGNHNYRGQISYDGKTFTSSEFRTTC